MSAAAASKGKGKLDAKGADAKGADVKGAAAKGADDIDSLFEDARKRKQNAAAEQRQQRKVETAASKRPRLAVAGGEGDDSSDDDAAGSSSRSGGLPGEYRGTGGKFELSKEPKPKVHRSEGVLPVYKYFHIGMHQRDGGGKYCPFDCDCCF